MDNALNFLTPEQLAAMTREEMVKRYEALNIVLEAIEAEQDAIKTHLMATMKSDSEVIADYSVSKSKRVSFTKTTLEDARALGAVCEAIDTKILKSLHTSGIVIPGVNVSEYLSVRKLKQ